MASLIVSMDNGHVQQTFTNGSIQLGPRHGRSSYVPRAYSSSFLTRMQIIKMLSKGPWFCGKVGLFLAPWFPHFDPSTTMITKLPIMVRLLNLLAHLCHYSSVSGYWKHLGWFSGCRSLARLVWSLHLWQDLHRTQHQQWIWMVVKSWAKEKCSRCLRVISST